MTKPLTPGQVNEILYPRWTCRCCDVVARAPTLEDIKKAADDIFNAPTPRPRLLLSAERYRKCKSGAHEIIYGFCIHCWTPE